MSEIAFLPISENDSLRINILKGILCILVICIHSNIVSYIDISGKEKFFEIPYTIRQLRIFIADILAATAVPIFFIISGYFYYQKTQPWILTWRKKWKTIVRPYVIWNTLYLLFFLIAETVPFTAHYLDSSLNKVADYNLWNWLDAYVPLRRSAPVDLPLWFILHLIVVLVLAPLIKYIVDKLPAATFCILAVGYYCNIGSPLLDAGDIFLFAVGYYLVKYDIRLSDIDKKLNPYVIWMLSLCLSIADLYTEMKIDFLHNIACMSGGLGLVLSSRWILHQKCLCDFFLHISKYSFFIYAMHYLPNMIFKKVSIRVFPLYGYWSLLQYISIVICTLGLCYMCAWLTKKYVPKLYSFLAGER